MTSHFSFSLLLFFGAILFFTSPAEAHSEHHLRGRSAVHDITALQYQYLGQALPPMYFRRYNITVTSITAHLVIKGYSDDVLNDVVHGVSATKFKHLKEEGVQVMFCHSEPNTETLGCTGGYTEELVLWAHARRVFDQQYYRCGGAVVACTAVDDLIADLKALFPTLEDMLHA